MKLCFFVFIFLSFGLKASVPSNSLDEELFFKAEKYKSNLKTKVTEVEGAVEIRLGDRELSAEHVKIDGKTGTVHSSGKLKYKKGNIQIEATSGSINMNTGLGQFKDAVIEVKGQLYLEGEHLERVGEKKFRIRRGKVTPCQDCLHSWSLMGMSIDVEVDGYAEAHHAYFQIKDVPLIYLPFVYLPVSSKRQSGLLIPETRFHRSLGFELTLPFFWAINDFSDLTLDYRYMTQGGNGLGAAYRYKASDRSFVNSRVSVVRNNIVPLVPDERFAFHIAQRKQWNAHWVQRFQSELASDPYYSMDFSDEFAYTRFSSLPTELSVEFQKEAMTASLELQFHQNNLAKSNIDKELGAQIHKLPEFSWQYSQIPVFKDLYLDLSLRSLSLYRTEDSLFSRLNSIDDNTGWIRTGHRVSPELSLYYPLEIFSRFEWSPQLNLKLDQYVFHSDVKDSTAHRFRFHHEQTLKTKFWGIWTLNSNNLKKIKHVWAPYVRWSYAPQDQDSGHAFFDQCSVLEPGTSCRKSPRFDLWDPGAEVGSETLRTYDVESRLGRHNQMRYGVEARFIGRWGAEQKSYRELLYMNLEQDYSLEDRRTGLLRFSAQLEDLKGFSFNTQYSYSFHTRDLNFVNEATYNLSFLSLSAFQNVNDERSYVGGGFKIKELGPFSFKAYVVYDDEEKKLQEQAYTLGYLSSSKCWNLELGLTKLPGSDLFDFMPSFQLRYSERLKKPKLESL